MIPLSTYIIIEDQFPFHDVYIVLYGAMYSSLNLEIYYHWLTLFDSFLFYPPLHIVEGIIQST